MHLASTLLLSAISEKNDFNSELYLPNPQNSKNLPNLAVELNYHNEFSLKSSLPFSLCVTPPLLSLSFSRLSSSRAAQMPWIKWGTKGRKETLLKNKGLPLGCHVLFWPKVHPAWFLLLSTCPGHKVNIVDPHYLTFFSLPSVPPTTSEALGLWYLRHS